MLKYLNFVEETVITLKVALKRSGALYKKKECLNIVEFGWGTGSASFWSEWHFNISIQFVFILTKNICTLCKHTNYVREECWNDQKDAMPRIILPSFSGHNS